MFLFKILSACYRLIDYQHNNGYFWVGLIQLLRVDYIIDRQNMKTIEFDFLLFTQ